MSLLPFGELPPASARTFLPARLDLGDWLQVEPWFDCLAERLPRFGDAVELERWLLDWGELGAALDEESSRRHIAMTCHTEDAAAERAYLHFAEEIEPRVKPRQFQLERAYLAHPARSGLPAGRFEVFDRRTALRVDLFREENVALETEETRLGQKFQKLSGSLTVPFRGEERTLAQMGRFLEENDRSTRQEAWEAIASRRLAEAERFEEIFEGLLAVREKIARNAGFVNYRDYAFRRLCRFDYTPADCLEFHATVEGEFMPVVRGLQADRARRMGVGTLRPWDLAADPEGRPALRPFERVEDLVSGVQRMLDHVDAGLAGQFRRMQSLRLLDLDNRKGKAPGGYQAGLAESRMPFIFMNAVGIQRDVETLLHEAGHAFHAFASAGENFFPYRASIPIEFCEVASMSMELLAGEHLEAMLPAAEARRARQAHMEDTLAFFPWMASVDAFQHWLYTHPAHTRAERRQAWVGVMDRFGGAVDWSGHEEARALWWHRQLHVFLDPFYYVEYGIAQLGALQVWANSRRDPARALAAYKRALALGGSRPLPELFAEAEIPFDFSTATARPLLSLATAAIARGH